MKYLIFILIICYQEFYGQQLSLTSFGTKVVGTTSFPMASGMVTGSIAYDPTTDGYEQTQGCVAFAGNNVSSGDYNIYAPLSYAGNPNPFAYERVIVILDGFDLANSLSADGIFDLMGSLGPNILSGSLNTHIITVNYTNSQDYIERNGNMLIELLQRINNSKVGKEENIIIGASMGGLVARYALSTMENMGISHECKIMLTLDSPNRGANIPVAVQEHIRDLAGSSISPISGVANSVLDVLTSPAASQLLRYLVGTNGFPTRFPDTTPPANGQPFNNNFVTFFQKLQNINGCGRGYPGNCLNAAVSLGSLNGSGQLDNAGFLTIPGALATSYTITSPILNSLATSAANAALKAFLGFSVPGGSISMKFVNRNFNYPANGSGNMLTNSSGFFAEFSQSTIGTSNPIPIGPTNNNWHSANLPVSIDVAPGGSNDFFNFLVNEITNSANLQGSAMNNSIINAINSAMGTSFSFNLGLVSTNTLGLNHNHCFIPSISALDYRTTNMFYNINNEISTNNLSNTPFDWVTGLPGVNNPHITGIPLPIANSVSGLFNSSFQTSCAHFDNSINNVSPQRLFQKVQNNLDLGTTTMANGSNFELRAGNQIALLNGSSFQYGSNGAVFINPCNAPKACSFSFSALKGVRGEDTFWDMTATQEDAMKAFLENKYCLTSVTKNGETFSYYDVCSNKDEKSQKNDEVTTIGSIEDIVESDKQGFFVFPNPSSGNITIVTSANSILQKVVIMDQLGKKVLEQSFEDKNKLTLDISELSKGIYLMNLYSGDLLIGKDKLIIN